MTRIAVCLAALLLPGAAVAQFVPDAPPFVRADPSLGRPVDQFRSGPYGDPSLSRQGPMATPHPMFRDPARNVLSDRPTTAPTLGQGALPLVGQRPRVAAPPPAFSARAPVITLKGRAVARGPIMVDSLKDVGRAIGRCWNPPRVGAPVEVTLRVSFKRDGTVIGEPTTPYVSTKDAQTRATMRAAALAAVRDCAPLRFTPGAGSAMAGRFFLFRMIALPPGRQQSI